METELKKNAHAVLGRVCENAVPVVMTGTNSFLAVIAAAQKQKRNICGSHRTTIAQQKNE